jgi:hypothetical protein
MNLHIPTSSRIGRIVLVLAVACLLAVFASVIFVGAQNADNNLPTANTAAPTRARVAESFGRLPLSFELNKGQIDKQVKFLSHGPGYDLFLTSTEAVLRVQNPTALKAEKSKDQDVREGTVLRLKMLGASATPQVEGQEELPGKIHYFIGNDAAKWRRNIPTYRKAYFKDIYPGIDVVYYGTQQELEYDFVIGPGANPKLIRFSVEGADKIRLDKSGKLLLSLKHGEVSLNKPVIYQLDENGSRREVKGTYVVKGNEVRFKLDRFDSGKALIIDPVLSYSTLLGSFNSDGANGIAVDSQGSAYVTGTAEFSGFPTTPGAFQTTSPRGGAFITKLDPTGSTLVYSTYLSGENNSTRGNGIAVDATGNAYVTGTSEGNNFPSVNPLKTTSTFFTTSDAAANWNNLNKGLVGDIQSLAVAPTAPNTIYAPTTDGFYRSTDGGANWSKTPSQGSSSPSFNGANGIAVDPTNSATVYVAFFNNLMKTTDGGNTWTGVNTSPAGFFNIFTIVIDPVTPSTMYVGAGNGVFKSTDSGANWIVQNNFGVPSTPIVRTLAIDPTNSLTIYAGTNGNGLFKSTNGGAIWTAMNTGMTGPGVSNVGSIAIDPANPQTIYAGTSLPGTIFKSTNGAVSWDPLTNGVPSVGINAIVVNSSGVFASVPETGVIKSTNGGANWTSASNGLWNSAVRFLVAHPSNTSVLYAATNSSFSADAFVTKLNASGSGLLFSTLLGGNDGDLGNGIALDSNGNVVIVGSTGSLNFPTVNAVQGSPPSDSHNGFVTKLNPSAPSIVFSTYLRGSSADIALGVAIDSSSNVYVTGLTNSSDFLTANAFQPTFSGGFNGDAFVTKLTPAGALTYSTFLGGTGTENGQAIAADKFGNAYVTGFTDSTNFPTKDPIQPTLGGSSNADVFVTKLSSDGSSLVYSTYLGGTASDFGEGIAIDSANNVYLTGWSQSIDFPLVEGAMRTNSPMYKSVNGAASWGNDNYGFNATGITATTITSMVIHPTEPSTVYAGTVSGVFKTTNGGRNWTAMNNGLANRNVLAMVINPSSPATLYVAIGSGFQSDTGVYKSTDGGGTWIRRSTGIFHTELVSLAIDPSVPNTLYLGVNPCCSVGGSHIYKTTDGADNWALIANALPVSPVSIVVGPLNHSTVYVADATSQGALYKSTNSGASFDKFTLAPNSPVRWVAVSPHTAGLVYATLDQGLFRSTDGGANWTQLPSRFGKIYFDPVSPTTVYLLAGSFTNSNVFKSTDNGQTWTLMNKGLNGGVPAALVIDPLRPLNLYLGAPSSFVQDAFVTKINSAGNSLVYSTFIGSPLPQTTLNTPSAGSAIAVDSSGNAYVTGSTSAAGFAVTPNSYQPFLRGASDAFISKLSNSYIISGRVLNSGDVPLSGAEVVLNDGGSLTSVLTENDGSYQFSRLREGGNYTVSASKPHFTMTPASQTFNNLNSDMVQDFAALQSDSPFYTISGQITENGAVLPGVTVTLTGSQVGLRTTDNSGNYSFELIVGGNYTVTPSLLGFNFAPASATFNSLSASQIANFAATRQTFVVTNTNNHGAGSLREAITNANATIGTDTITFNIPGPGVKTINPLTALPEITDRVVIDATTQPGYAGTPLIEIDGSMANASDGLMIKAGGTTVRGLSIGRFGSNAINLNGCDGNVIQGNYLGVAADGTTARQSNWGIQLTNSSNNLIGGTTAAARNVISGNGNSAIAINSGNSNVIQGNFIGTTAAGTAVLTASFTSFGGIRIPEPTSIDNLIGGSAPGAGNVISGINGFGISTSGTGTVIQGNRIGTDLNGVNKIPNSGGVLATGSNILVGGTTTEARNVISGNGDGVTISGPGSRLQGNYIGTDITGTLALGNTGNGVVAGDGALIGGTAPEMRNIIAANSSNNVSLGSFGASAPVTVQGNYIGTDVTGSRALGTTNIGILIGSNNNLVGGVVPGARNVISGNINGVQLGFSSVVGNIIQGNFIGLNAAGTAPLGNTGQGVFITGAINNIIGGTQTGAGNKIAFNGGAGVAITGSGQGNAIRGNSIFSNTGLGIDLGGNGVTPNDDSDSDSGVNNLQNFPVITGVLSSSNSTTIQGTLKSLPGTTFQIDFYSNAAVDPSGNGEGAVFFGTASVNTNGNGDAAINATIPTGLLTGRVITATATDPNGNTSEFSAADASGTAGSVQFTATSMQVIEDVGTLSVTVVRTGGSTGSVSVDYSTANGTAIAGQDYTSTSGTLTFNGGETSKTIQIPITNDSPTETDETFTVFLRNDANLEAVGAPSTLVVTLQDRNTTPVIFINSVAVQEGNTGSTTEASFIINLSAATGRAVSVNFATTNLGATGGNKCGTPGVDYESASGTLSFSPTDTAFAIPIKVCGDNNAEANENFRIAFSNPIGAAVQVNSGFSTIVDDDLLELLLEESGPVPGQAAAVDALLAVRDPFRVQGIPDFWPNVVDRNTRVAFYVRNLQLNPGETSSSVFVRFINGFSVVASVAAEDVRPIPNSEFTQVVVRLPNNLLPNTYTIQILAHSRLSNTGTIRIIP